MVAGLALSAGGFSLGAYNVVTQVKEKRKRTQWDRKYSLTKALSGTSLSAFAIWFQTHEELANHKVEGVEGILTDPCLLPAIGKPFKCDKVVLNLGFHSSAYLLTIASNTKTEMTAYWTQVEEEAANDEGSGVEMTELAGGESDVVEMDTDAEEEEEDDV